MKQQLVIGSRGSKLALTQAEIIKTELQAVDTSLNIRIEIIKTSGDIKTEPLAAIGGKGVFTKELEEALLRRTIDVAVHSLKDLPTIVPDGLSIAAICKREDPRDALVLGRKLRRVASIKALPEGTVIGTSSPRRLAQLKHLRSDLIIKELRGNIDTRLRTLDEQNYDALVLACAGLRRLGLEKRINVAIPVGDMLPAVGQGALGLEIRSDDAETSAIVTQLDHKFTRLACAAERSFLRALGGGCQLPIAGHAVVRNKEIRLDGLVAEPSGGSVVRGRLIGNFDEAEALGKQLAEQLWNAGAKDLLASDS